MAVFQGARLGTSALPQASAVARPRPTTPTTIGSASRARPMGLLIGGILTATMLGLVYLTQTLGANATSSEIRDLQAKQVVLESALDRQAAEVRALVDPDEVISKASKLHLRKLDRRLVLRAPAE